MAAVVDVLCLSAEQQKNLNDLLTKARFLVEIKNNGLADSAIHIVIDEIAAVLRKIDKS